MKYLLYIRPRKKSLSLISACIEGQIKFPCWDFTDEIFSFPTPTPYGREGDEGEKDEKHIIFLGLMQIWFCADCHSEVLIFFTRNKVISVPASCRTFECETNITAWLGLMHGLSNQFFYQHHIQYGEQL